jgi:hypothetical protein
MNNNNIDINLNPKQYIAMNYLYNSNKNVIVYGGAAGGGKSYLGCTFIISYCLKYTEIRCMIGRYTLASLKNSTLITFLSILKKYNINYDYNRSEHIITFDNNSSVKFQQLPELPSDLDYDYLGSTEYTAVFVDEFTQITKKCYNIIQTRIRWKLKEYNLRPILFLSCNPSNNWVKDTIYDKWVKDELNENIVFIPASIEDNAKNLSLEYINSFNNLDEITRERLRYGNWDYNKEFNQIYDMEVLYQLFDKTYTIEKPNYYLSIDVARFGKDSTVIMLWNNYHLCDVFQLKQNDITQQYEFINNIILKYNIRRNQIAIDSDGVGGGLADMLKQSIHIVNNAKALKGDLYQNLKTQLYFKSSELVNDSKITFDKNIQKEFKDKLIQELNFIIKKEQKADEKICLENKDFIKKKLNRSPDFSDAFAYRFIFEFKNNKIAVL